MQYRQMPKSPDRLSILGYGCMRFPTTESGQIKEDKALELLHYAYDRGVNYFDSAWNYHLGESEPLLGKFLGTIDRGKAFVATKLPSWEIKKREDLDRYLDEQLERLQTDYIDYYLLHSLNSKNWENLLQHDILSFLEKAKSSGKIRFAGFSFHDHYEIFSRIVQSWTWDFTLIMLNYLDTEYQAGLQGYKLALQNDMGVLVMEPLRGGKLVAPVPDEVKDIWQKSRYKGSMADRSLRWVWNLPGCTTVLSGMSNLEQLKENIDLAGRHRANEIDEEELKLYASARREYIKRIAVPCTECRYCLPCPQGVLIPSVIGVYNEAVMFGDRERHRKEYFDFIPEKGRADCCTSCGECLPKCPRNIDIPEVMKKIAGYFKE